MAIKDLRKPNAEAYPANEHLLQVAVMGWARLSAGAYPELELMFAIPNGGQRNKIVASKLKAEGVKAGVPDLCLPVPRRGRSALYLELKVKGGKLSDSQKGWLGRLDEAGNCCAVANTLEGALEILKWYLKK